jgi:hypothetical protein
VQVCDNDVHKNLLEDKFTDLALLDHVVIDANGLI